jgi:hypothetical protein
MHRTAIHRLLAIALALASSSVVLAQSEIARLTHVDSGSSRLHAGALAESTIGVSLIDGDQIQTSTGRAEITYFDGTVISLDRHTRAIVNAGERFQLLQGRVSLRTGGLRPYVAETTVARLHVQAGSIAEITIRPDAQDTFVRVISGAARLEGAWGSRRVTDYHTAYVAGPGATPEVAKVPVVNADEFERWALARTVLATSIVLKGTEGGAGVAEAPVRYSGYYAAPAYAYEPTPYVTPHTVAPFYNPSYYTPYSYGSSYYGSYYPAYSYPSRYSRSYAYSPYSYYNYQSTPHHPAASYGHRAPRGPQHHRAPIVQHRTPRTPNVRGATRGAVIPRP